MKNGFRKIVNFAKVATANKGIPLTCALAASGVAGLMADGRLTTAEALFYGKEYSPIIPIHS